MLRQCVGYDFSGAITVTCKMGEVEVNGTGSVLRFAENDAAKKMLDLLDSQAHPEKRQDEEIPGTLQTPASSEKIQTPPKVHKLVRCKLSLFSFSTRVTDTKFILNHGKGLV